MEMSFAADYSKTVATPQPDSKLTRHQATNFFNNLYSNTVIFPRYGVRFTADDRFLTGDPFKTYANPDRSDPGQELPVRAVHDSLERERQDWSTGSPTSCG